jgi:cytochrome b involved in lipid metabolism
VIRPASPVKKRVRVFIPEAEKPFGRSISRADVRRHSTKSSCWTIYHKKVYDITAFVSIHPGGDALLAAAGKDCEAHVQQAHAWIDVGERLKTYCIGDLVDESGAISS